MSEAFKSPAAAADELGLNLVLPKDNELFIDIDDKESEDHYQVMRGVLAANGVLTEEITRTVSKSGNTHVYLRMLSLPLTPEKRIAYQAVLGSDRKRELLSLLRIDLGTNYHPTVFFEVPVKETAAA